MIELSKITLVTIDGTGKDTEKILDVIDICTRKIQFGSVILITSDKNIKSNDKIIIHNIENMSYPEYNTFCITDLNSYVNTDYCLIVQTDGYICKPTNWTDEFFNYDYIGCPWIHMKPGHFPWVIEPKHEVGCGGFCLRSKKLLQAGANLNKEFISKMTNSGMGEDIIICVSLRNYFEQMGCIFPTGEFAKKFALGSMLVTEQELETTFGFHSGLFIPMVSKIIERWNDYESL
jgi:hypothetical protein